MKAVAADAARAVADRLGHTRHLARVGGGSTSEAFRVGDTLLLVAPAGTDAVHLAARLRVAAALPEAVRLVRPVPGVAEPMSAGGRLVTAWEWVPNSSGPLSWFDVGVAVRSLHAADVPVGSTLRRVPDPDDLRRRVGKLAAAGLGDHWMRVLDAVTRRLADELAAAGTDHGGDVLLHGDLHEPNLLRTPTGVTLCDIDELAVGPAAYDLGFLTDPARPTLPPQAAARDQFEAGYGGGLPPLAEARTMARMAHLRRTVGQLEGAARPPRQRYFDRLRLASWEDVLRDWGSDLHPVVTQPRHRQLVRVLTSFRHPGVP